jgi:choline dehydrogenase-like flavoprotein
MRPGFVAQISTARREARRLMLLTAGDLTESELQTDVVIVGAGAAGLTLAHTLAAQNIGVILLEQGSTKAAKGLRGEDVEFGAQHFRSDFETGIGVGGTTNLWGGQCMRLEPMDLQSRSWIPCSGWPLRYETLASYYAKADAFLGISTRLPAAFLTPTASTTLELAESVFCHPDLKRRVLPGLTRSRHAHLLTGARVTGLIRRESQIVGLDVAAGHPLRLRGKTWVLACGTLENARLLLSPTSSCPGGVNPGDLVGRYLQDHPNGRIAAIDASDYRALQNRLGFQNRNRQTVLPKIAAAAGVLEQNEALRSGAQLAYDYPAGSVPSVARELTSALAERRFDARTVTAAGKALPGLARSAIQRKRGRPDFSRPQQLWLHAFSEQLPTPENRVRLSATRDESGRPRLVINWRIEDEVKNGFELLTRTASHAFTAGGFGRATSALAPADGDWRAALKDNNHQVGTTRMSASPSEGVVDSDCRVHGLDNLFITGGSVFPTSSYVNPTLTIIALAIRLGELLSNERAR